jgi:phage terminase small subunit
MAKLSDKQRRFCEEYLIDLNATQAAIRAGYSPRTANEQASRLLAKVSIRSCIDISLAELSKRTGVTAERVIRELAKIAFVNPPNAINIDDAMINRYATDEDTACIQSIKVKVIPTKDGEVVEREIKFADKTKALELLGKHQGLFTDNINISGGLGVKIIDDIPREPNSE